MSDTYFKILGLPENANDAQIADARKKRKAECQNDPAQLERIEEAYRVLANPLTRSRYLKMLRTDGPAGAGGGISPQAEPAGEKPATDSSISAPRPTDFLKRQPMARPKTEFLDPSQLPGNTAPQPGPAQAAVQPNSTPGQVSARPKTQFLDLPTASKEQKNTGEPAKEPPGGAAGAKPGAAAGTASARGPRPKTEYLDLNNPSAGAPSEPGANQSAQPGRDSSTRRSRSEDTRTLDQQATPAKLLTVRVAVSYQGKTEEFTLQPGVNIIGRPSPGSTESPSVPLPDPERYVSRRHAVIVIDGNRCVIRDESSNGTLLNGQRLPRTQEFPLSDGAEVIIEGRRLLFHFN
jgi:curved DNA-binding protein CbpA